MRLPRTQPNIHKHLWPKGIISAVSLFTSARERRLWFALAAVLMAIYATLGPAGTLVAILREHNLLRISIVFVLLLVVVAFAWQWVKRRPSPGEIMVLLGVTAVYLLAWFRIPIPEERTHLIEYGLVAVLIYLALSERRRNGRRVPMPAVLALVVAVLLGWLDEGVQSILPNRVYDIRDVGFNALAGLMAIAASLALVRVRRMKK